MQKYNRKILFFTFIIIIVSPIFTIDKYSPEKIKEQEISNINNSLDELKKDFKDLSGKLATLEEKLEYKKEMLDRLNLLEERRLTDKASYLNFLITIWPFIVVILGFAPGIYAYIKFREFNKEFTRVLKRIDTIKGKIEPISSMQKQLKNDRERMQEQLEEAWDRIQALYLYEQGTRLLYEGDYIGARDLFLDSLDLSKTKEIYFSIASTFIRENIDILPQAIEYLNDAIRIDPEFKRAKKLSKKYQDRLSFYKITGVDKVGSDELDQFREGF